MYDRPRINVKVEQGSTFTYKRDLPYIVSILFSRLRVVPHFSSGIVERAKPSARENHPREKRRHAAGREKNEKSEKFFSLPAACRLFSRGVIFTRGRVSLALLSLRTNGGLLVV